MLNMQNLQSQTTDTIFASGQSVSKKSDSGSRAGSTPETVFDRIIGETLRCGRQQSSAGRTSAAEDDDSGQDQNPHTSVSDADRGKNAAAAGSRPGDEDAADGATDEKAAGNPAAPSTGAQLLAMAAVAAGAPVPAPQPDQTAAPAAAAAKAPEAVTTIQTAAQASAAALTVAGAADSGQNRQIPLQTAAVMKNQVQKAAVSAGQQQTAAAEVAGNSASAQVKIPGSGTAAALQPQAQNLQVHGTDNAAAEPVTQDSGTATADDKLPPAALHVFQGPAAAAPAFTVKVSDGTRLTQQLTTQVADTISANITDNVSEFMITISPADLGRIDIRISLTEGKAHVVMTCTQEATRKALLGNQNAVRQIIEAGTGQESVITVHHNPEQDAQQYHGSSGGNQYQRGSSNGQRGHSGEDDAKSFIQQLRLGLVGDTDQEAV